MSKDDERRTQAAAAKAAADSAAKKERLVRFVGSGVVVAIVAVIIGVGVFASSNSDAEGNGTIPLTGTLPTGVAEDGSWTYNPEAETEATLDLYKDFQCPGCGWFEGTYGLAVKQLADDGIVKVVLHPAVFLDNNFDGQHSSRALNALGCAIDQGVGVEFKGLVYASQPATEGDGWTDVQFLELGSAAGIKDVPAFETCVIQHEHMIWAEVATESFTASGVSSTPTVRLNGTNIPEDVLNAADPTAFYEWVKANA